jgi:hypothetical protein
MVFQEVRERAEAGDWFVRLDADEFYHSAPPDFVRNHVLSHEGAIYMQWYDFKLTTSELESYERGLSLVDDRALPIEQRRCHYKIVEYGEPRIFRYRPSMRWPSSASFPCLAGCVARKRIPIRHYPHRDPVQLQHRFKLRREMRAFMYKDIGSHWDVDHWTAVVVPDADQDLRFWSPGAPLPTFDFTNHVAPLGATPTFLDAPWSDAALTASGADTTWHPPWEATRMFVFGPTAKVAM